MQAIKRRGSVRRGNIIYIPTDELEPSDAIPRTHFDDDGIAELADSISEHGILNPLTVRLRDDGFELIAGERRLRAARLLGLSEVPCILLDLSREEASLVALTENLQRRDLDLAEETNGIQRLVELYGMSRGEIERHIGKSRAMTASKPKRVFVMKDVRVFLNTLSHGVELMKNGGIDASFTQTETENEMILTVTIAKKNE